MFRGTQNDQEKLPALASDNILLKWSQTVELLVSVPFKKSPCLNVPSFLGTPGRDEK